jgi:hypothetical protein
MHVLKTAGPAMTSALRKRVLRSIANEQLPYYAGQEIIKLIGQIDNIIKDPQSVRPAEEQNKEASVA